MSKRASESSVPASKRTVAPADKVDSIISDNISFYEDKNPKDVHVCQQRPCENRPSEIEAIDISKRDVLKWSILFSEPLDLKTQQQISLALQTEISTETRWSSDGDRVFFPPKNPSRLLLVLYECLDISCPNAKIVHFERTRMRKITKSDI